jgi:hypothetical protein
VEGNNGAKENQQNNNMYHEAGYDALITGLSFLRMMKYQQLKNNNHSDIIEQDTIQNS